MIYVENKKRKLENIQKEYPGAIILDITSASESNYAKWLSPFSPHYNIPIPFPENLTATCVEAVWQGLKVFKNQDVDFDTFRNDTMKNLKRTVRRFGQPLGHRKGAYGKELLNYFDARMQIYLPTYKWVLDNVEKVHHVIERIAAKSKEQDIVLLDYNTNTDFRDISKPISHAGLVKLYIEGKYPSKDDAFLPMTQEELKIKSKNKRDEKAKRRKVTGKMAASNDTLFPSPQTSIKAICVKDVDPWRESRFEELHVGDAYTPEYLVIGRSWSYLCIKEQPGKEYNSVMFSYQEDDGRSIDFSKDIVRPIMERYRDYLYNEMNLTGTWEVYVKMCDNPINTVPEKNKYKVVRYGSFDLESKRTALQDI